MSAAFSKWLDSLLNRNKASCALLIFKALRVVRLFPIFFLAGYYLFVSPDQKMFEGREGVRETKTERESLCTCLLHFV